MDEQKTVMEAPRYKCHKVVRAAKVIGWKAAEHALELDGGLADFDAKVGWNESMVGGYLVVYDDGYTSYSPANAFEEGYAAFPPPPRLHVTFGEALQELKEGRKVARAGWNGKAMWLALIPADQWGLGSSVPFDDGHVDAPAKLPWIGMRTADNRFVPWLASQTDMLAEDWEIIS